MAVVIIGFFMLIILGITGMMIYLTIEQTKATLAAEQPAGQNTAQEPEKTQEPAQAPPAPIPVDPVTVDASFAPTNDHLASMANGSYCLDNKDGTSKPIYPIQTVGCWNDLAQRWTFSSTSKTLQNKISGNCLTAKNELAAVGDEVGLDICTLSPKQNQWEYTNTKQLRLANNVSLCLDAGDPNALKLATCDANSQSQKFQIPAEFTPGVEFVNGDHVLARYGTTTAMCLDNWDDKRADQEQIGLADCHKHPAQRWTYDKVSKRLINGSSSLCLTSSDKIEGSKIGLKTCDGANKNQMWTWDTTNNALALSVNKTMCATVDPSIVSKGRPGLTLRTCDKSPTQTWAKESTQYAE